MREGGRERREGRAVDIKPERVARLCGAREGPIKPAGHTRAAIMKGIKVQRLDL